MTISETYKEKENCPFCNKNKIKSDIIERDGCLIFEPLNPVVRGHLLIVPTNHVEDFTTDTIITECVMRVAGLVAKEKGGEYNLITSKGRNATQSVFHFHVHLVPREVNDGLALPWDITSTLTTILQGEVERLEKMKPTALGRHHTYCLYRKGDGTRDLWECDCEIIQYTKAIDDHQTYLNEQIKLLSK